MSQNTADRGDGKSAQRRLTVQIGGADAAGTGRTGLEKEMTTSDLLKIAAAVALAAGTLAGAASAQGMGQGVGQGMGMGPGGGRPVFAELDANADGQITAEDIEARRTARFAALDADGNGQVSLAEFQAEASARAAERAATVFERLDADGDGILSRDVIEMRGGRDGFEVRVIERFDANGDGALSEEEFDAIADRMAEMRGHRGEGRGHGDGCGDGRGGWFHWN
jgi:Ca2+-binding EF-hand superfamily protein